MKILRLKQVIEMSGMSRTTIYRLMDDGKFPLSVKLSERSVGWIEDDILSWIESRQH